VKINDYFMKNVAVTILILFAFKVSSAQTFDEWFKQKKTQKRYLIEQIAAFKIYLGYVQKGYSITRKGLTTIGNIKEGDFNSHNDFFNSFKSVNPTIKNYSKVGDIIAFQVEIIQSYKSAYKYVQSISLYNPHEIDFIYRVYTNLVNNSSNDLDELITAITTNELEMKDDERLKRIDAIYTSMQDKYAFAKSFGDQAKVLAVQKAKDKNNIETSRSFYGIKN
jgi:multidrug efflux pump subunit AcrB